MDQSQAALRHFISAGVILFPLVCSPPHPARADDIGANQSELIQRLLPTVVNILVTKDEPLDVSAAAPADAAAPAPPPDATPNIRAYAGSGFVIDRSGLIVTNYHVVQNAFEINVTFSDGSRLPGTMLQASRLADLAILKVDAGHPLQEAHWGDSSRLRVGQQVFAAGNPLGIGLSVSAGIISALNRDIQNSPFDDLIQTDATINHGNSGGPLFNMQGEVISVDSNIISPTSGSSGLGFAVPSATARFVVNQLMKYGWIRPAWIGVKVQTVTPELADAMGGTSPPGTSVISWVVADSPGDKAGLQIGDVIERYDGIVPTDDRNLLRQIAHTPIGEKISFLVRRNGAERTVLVATETWPRDRSGLL